MNSSKPKEKETGFSKVHRRNRTLEKLISASTIMAPTHDRVIGMDPDDVKTPISAPHPQGWELDNANEVRSPLLARTSTNLKHNGDVNTREVEADEEERPQLPTRPSEIAGYGGAELAKTRTQEAGEKLRVDMHSVAEKVRQFGHKHDPKSPYFTITEAVHKHMRKVYDELCQGEKGLRTSEFMRFLKEQQRQEIGFPDDTHKKRDFTLTGVKRWTYEDWLAFMCYYGALDGVRLVGKAGLVRPEGLKLKKDEMTEEERDALRYPITSYFIDSSHNTYLQGHQWFSESTADAYKYVLQKGCRCIEIDVHNGDMALKKAPGVKEMLKPTGPSELISIGSKKFDKGKSKVDEIKSSAKKWFHNKKESISGGKKSPPKSPRTVELSREFDVKDMDHRRNQSSTSTVPKISRDPTSDSEGGSIVGSDDGTAVDLTADGKPGSKKSSRASSKSSDASSIHPERTGEPIVMHGWTPTTSWCLFRDVCKTVAKHAFETTDLPLIVSLEVACTWDQQELMVKIMKEEWGTILVDKPLPDCDPAIRQPRLDELFNKILVKVKRHVPTGEEVAENAKAEAEVKLENAKPNGQEEKVPQPLFMDAVEPQSSTASSQTTLLTPNASTTGTSSTAVSSYSATPTATPAGASLSPSASANKLESLDTTPTKSSNHSRSRSPSNPQPNKPAKLPKICQNLSALGIYTHSAHFAKFTDTSSYTPSHIYSIDEHDILDLYEKQTAAMHAHNKKYFMRAYPEWKRIGSSNLDPSVYWRKGVQMAAVNAQTWDEGTMVNRGMFEGTGGWVLKPANLRPTVQNPTWNPNATNREDAEAGINGAAQDRAPLATPATETLCALLPTSFNSPTETKSPIGLGLGLESHPEPELKPLPRAAALDPPQAPPSKKEKVRSPRPSDASQGPKPTFPMSPKSSSTSIVGSPKTPKTPSVFSGLVVGPALQKSEPQALALKDSGKNQSKTLTYTFRIYAAQGLKGDKDMHARVKIEMHAERDGEYKSDDWKKETKSRHTTNPDWNGEEVRFSGIGSKGDPGDHVRGHVAGPQEELSFVRFKIEDDNTLKRDVMVAWRAVRLDRLRVGWRFLRLWDWEGEIGGGLLLVHVGREEV